MSCWLFLATSHYDTQICCSNLLYDHLLLLQTVNEFIKSVKNICEQKKRPVIGITRSFAVKFLWARKFDINRAILLYIQHEETRQREGLFGFNCAVEPLKSELQTQKFTILVLLSVSFNLPCVYVYICYSQLEIQQVLL